MNSLRSNLRVSRFRRLAAAATVSLVGLIAAAASADFRSPLEEASAIQQQLRTVVEHSTRSVFAVTAFTDVPTEPALYASHIDGPTFAKIAERMGRSCGSAFAIDSAGRLVTNEHVVSGAASVWVTDDAGHVMPAVVLGTDPRSDMAVLQIPIETDALAVATQTPSRGDMVVALGNPDGLATDGELSASVGCVSATGRSLPTLSARERRSYADLLQTTTPVAVGGSGGPLVNLEGKVVGVVSAVATADRDGMPVGFAIPLAPPMLARVGKLSRGEEIVHPYFGVSIGISAPTTQPSESTARGVTIEHVEAATPADGLLLVGDVVTTLAGQSITSDRSFLQLAGACQVEQPVPLTVQRAGSTVNVVLRPTRRPLPAEPVTHDTQRFHWAGVTFANAEDGVAVIENASPDGSPLVAGGVVRAVNGHRVRDVSELARAIVDHIGSTLDLEVR